MYTDLYLKFADQAQADAILYTEDTPNYQNIDVLGIIYKHQDNPEATPIAEEGWHVNVRLVTGEKAAPLMPFKIEPQHPRRVWA
jgi:hypothetical protein